MPSLRREMSLKAALLAVAGALSASVGCGSDGSQATGTKTDWLIACDVEADCDAMQDLSCLCGICTKTCSSEADCEQGSCGSNIATAAACGNTSEFIAQGERICLPETEDECVWAPLSTGTDLGDAAPLACSLGGALICEDFDGPLPEGYSTWGSGQSTASLQECQVRSGAGSLGIVGIDDAYSQTRMRLPAAVSSGALHVRFYVRVQGGGVFPEQLILFEFWDQEEGEIDDRTTIYLNASEQLEVYVGSGSQTLQSDPGTPLARDEWHCVELGLELSDTAGAVMMSVGDRSLIDRTDIDTLPSDPVSVAVVEGVPSKGSLGTEVTFFIDDLVVATEPIGCD